ncbi:MAG: hypothetical protein HYW57_10960 [Ignavibacteriales bacterium]|nr:hypothetical protein [Ignavibacteriales bacterium]
MATKPPPPVDEFSPDTLEKIAYSIVADIETQEPNDRNRLGYNLWAWLRERKGTLAEAVRAAGSRTKLSQAEVLDLIRQRLQERGIKPT